jgi:hypothetical protein
MADRLWDEERKLLLSVYGLWELEAIETATLFFFLPAHHGRFSE